MDATRKQRLPERKDDRVIIHFDYDCFYASVFEAENPALKSLPLAVQQKQIIVTCNYEARKRGLYKLQLITEAKRLCPDVIIVLGEDISRFRDASKDLYSFLVPFSWSRKVERLGFDEVWFDVTDTIKYNIDLLNPHDLRNSFFQLSKDDPTTGFPFDATMFSGPTFPPSATAVADAELLMPDLNLRLRLGSHLAQHMRFELEKHRGYTATVGIATSKLLSKLVGDLNKPRGQTTLIPPLSRCEGNGEGNATVFLDSHDIGKVPGIGFKMSQKIRAHVLGRGAAFDDGLVYGGTKENVTVRDVRLSPDVNAEKLEQILAGPGAPHGIGGRVWRLINAIDDSEVAAARQVPRQISIEDSYIRLDTMSEVLKELTMLSKSLLNRMRVDLLEDTDDSQGHVSVGEQADDEGTTMLQVKRWLAHPKTIRLSTRPRMPLNADGTRTRSFKRISHSGPLPNFVFSLSDSMDILADRLVQEVLVPMFKRLHPEKHGWNLSLVNVAVTNMVETGGEEKGKSGRDIAGMFRRQEDVLKDFKVVEEDDIINNETAADESRLEPLDSRDGLAPAQSAAHQPVPPAETCLEHVPYEEGMEDGVDDFDEEHVTDLIGDGQACSVCGVVLPDFALQAHERFHRLEDWER